LNSKQAYYSYVIPDGMRPDSLSYNYYDNPDYVWLIALSNQINDPYYDYPLDDYDLNNFIIQKYGSIAAAQQKILYFQTNWAIDESNISPTYYASLGVGQQKYWDPNIDQNNNIYEYVRKQEDWIVTTNMVQQVPLQYSTEITTESGLVLDTENGYDITAPEGGSEFISFVVGELVAQNGVTLGTVSYVDPNDQYILIQHIAVTPTVGPIVGLTSGASATVSSTPVTLSTNIPSDELIYWSPVTAYDYETAKNTANKSINLLDNKYATQATKELKALLLT